MILLDFATCGQEQEKTYAELFTLLNCISEGNPEWNRGSARPVVLKTVRKRQTYSAKDGRGFGS